MCFFKELGFLFVFLMLAFSICFSFSALVFIISFFLSFACSVGLFIT